MTKRQRERESGQVRRERYKNISTHTHADVYALLLHTTYLSYFALNFFCRFRCYLHLVEGNMLKYIISGTAVRLYQRFFPQTNFVCLLQLKGSVPLFLCLGCHYFLNLCSSSGVVSIVIQGELPDLCARCKKQVIRESRRMRDQLLLDYIKNMLEFGEHHRTPSKHLLLCVADGLHCEVQHYSSISKHVKLHGVTYGWVCFVAQADIVHLLLYRGRYISRRVVVWFVWFFVLGIHNPSSTTHSTLL